MSAPAVEARGVWVTYRPSTSKIPLLGAVFSKGGPVVNALAGVDLVVERGQSIGIIGRNGAGKSTLLRVVAGTLVPDHGTVEVRGSTSTLLALGSGFNADLTGRRNIWLGCLASGLSREQTAGLIDQILEFSELGPAIDRPLSTYSSGMVARLGFAIGVTLQPDILIVDEVLSVGDQAFRTKSRDAMRELVARSGNLIIASHQLKIFRELCDRALWLESGEVVEVGEPGPVIKAYRKWIRSR